MISSFRTTKMDSCLWATAAVLLASNAATQIGTLVGRGADADSSDTQSSSHASHGMPTADLCRREAIAAGSAFVFSTNSGSASGSSSARFAQTARAQRVGPLNPNYPQVIDDNAWTARTTAAELAEFDAAPKANRAAASTKVAGARAPEVITAAELGILRDASSAREWQSPLVGEKRFAAWTTDGTPGVDTRATWNGGDAENKREIQTMPVSFGVKRSSSDDAESTPPTFNGRVLVPTSIAPLGQEIAAAGVSTVPEPGTWMMMLSGLFGLGLLVRLRERVPLRKNIR